MQRDNTKYGKRHKPGEMNKTEQAYADLLHARQLSAEVIAWAFESMTFKLASDCRYTPDFSVWLSDGTLEFVDCKGGGPMDDKSRVKVRVAAQAFPMFKFVIEQKQPLKNGGGWKREEF